MKPSAADLHGLLTQPSMNSLAELYHENSKLTRVNSRPYGEYISQITGSPFLVEKMAHPYKTYPTRPRIALPAQFDDPPEPTRALYDIVRGRRTFQQFSGNPITIADAAQLLYFSYGITKRAPAGSSPLSGPSLRAVPSAGALYPLELYLVAWNVLTLEPAIYHYNVLDHELELIKHGDYADLARDYSLSNRPAEKASALFLVSAAFRRTAMKYLERGYRFIFLEAGHLAQNLCLTATALKLGVLPIGGFLDDEFNRLLGLDGVNEAVVYPLFVGKV
jgi:SagB-type dehydrogenase family enzyme